MLLPASPPHLAVSSSFLPSKFSLVRRWERKTSKTFAAALSGWRTADSPPFFLILPCGFQNLYAEPVSLLGREEVGRDLKNYNSENNDPVHGSFPRKLLSPLRLGEVLSSGFLQPQRLPFYCFVSSCVIQPPSQDPRESSGHFTHPPLTPIPHSKTRDRVLSPLLALSLSLPILLRVQMGQKGDIESPADPGLAHHTVKGLVRKATARETPVNTCAFNPGQTFDKTLILCESSWLPCTLGSEV